MKYLGAIVLILVSLGLFGSQDNTKKEKKARERLEMAHLIQNGKFQFVARSANSVLGNFNNLSYGYSMVFDSLHIVSFLPYYGRTFVVRNDNEGGVKFDLKADNINQQWVEKKKLFKLSTQLSDSREGYTIFLTAGLDGYAELSISFRDRTWMNYSGTIEKIPSKKD